MLVRKTGEWSTSLLEACVGCKGSDSIRVCFKERARACYPVIPQRSILGTTGGRDPNAMGINQVAVSPAVPYNVHS